MVHWRREWQTSPVFLLQELHEQYEKAKMSPAGWKVFSMLLGKNGGHFHESVQTLGDSEGQESLVLQSLAMPSVRLD